MRTGIVELPLHYGFCPSWLFKRMVELSRAIIEAIVYEFGRDEVLTRFSDPYWFQSFGCLLGFDWHSSGLTTTVCGAIKEALRGTERELGIYVAGGKGKTSRKTPQEIEFYGEKYSISQTENLIYASKMSAKVDNTALQDGFQIYHHTFIFTKEGKWVVIQQGLNQKIGLARRYHWLSTKVDNFINEPENAICCDWTGSVLNLVAKESDQTRKTSVKLLTKNFKEFLKDLEKVKILKMPRRHDILPIDFDFKKLEKIFWNIHEYGPKNFQEILEIKGVGPKTIRTLSLVSEIIYGAKPSYEDPVRYSFAHGGKDGVPYPVNKKAYDRSIEVLKRAIQKAKIGRYEKINLLKNLSLLNI